MNGNFEDLTMSQRPTSERPLLGHTVLLVEDSRFASEAVRLMSLRSGARIRRADCLASAERHLRSYCPTVAIVDMGLPDGSGARLIERLTNAKPRVSALLGTSGDDGAGELAMDAGADGFLAKPIDNLSSFQQLILSHLPNGMQPSGLRAMPIDTPTEPPDVLAFRDDIAHVAALLAQDNDGPTLDYVAQFLGELARAAEDHPLEAAAAALGRARDAGTDPQRDIAGLNGLVQDRLRDRRMVG